MAQGVSPVPFKCRSLTARELSEAAADASFLECSLKTAMDHRRFRRLEHESGDVHVEHMGLPRLDVFAQSLNWIAKGNRQTAFQVGDQVMAVYRDRLEHEAFIEEAIADNRYKIRWSHFTESVEDNVKRADELRLKGEAVGARDVNVAQSHGTWRYISHVRNALAATQSPHEEGGIEAAGSRSMRRMVLSHLRGKQRASVQMPHCRDLSSRMCSMSSPTAR
jgi:hypothetical protein